MCNEKGKEIYNTSCLAHVFKQVGRKTVKGPDYDSTKYVKKDGILRRIPAFVDDVRVYLGTKLDSSLLDHSSG
jgi:hypothetical protein